jgi:hypothetical protein
VGIHWYCWNNLKQDSKYPKYFPAKKGMGGLVKKLRGKFGATIMPYINGRLYDTTLKDYAKNGFPYATKNNMGKALTQKFNGTVFAVMCPTQKPWRRMIVDATIKLSGTLNADAVYIDQVCASTPIECMDASHHHTLGGGHFWRDGYAAMLREAHKRLPKKTFITVESASDYLADQVDGFLTDGWTTDNLVPAFNVIYGGRVQFFGTKTGTSTYKKPSFYCKLAQSFVHGVQPGRFSLWIVKDPNAKTAKTFVLKLATMRHKLKEFLAFGVQQRPLRLKGDIPMITSSGWMDYGKNITATVPAVRNGVYKNAEGDAMAIILVNASISETVKFSFDFYAKKYGLKRPFTETVLRPFEKAEKRRKAISSAHNATLPPMDVVAYIFKQK